MHLILLDVGTMVIAEDNSVKSDNLLLLLIKAKVQYMVCVM